MVGVRCVANFHYYNLYLMDRGPLFHQLPVSRDFYLPSCLWQMCTLFIRLTGAPYMALQSVHGWQPFLPGSKLRTHKAEHSETFCPFLFLFFVFSRLSSTAKWLEQSGPPGEHKHNAVVSPKMKRGQCLGRGGNRHLREKTRNRFVLKKAAGSTHINSDLSPLWKVHAGGDAVSQPFIPSNKEKADHLLDFWTWSKFFRLLLF